MGYHLKILQKLWKKYFFGSNRVWTRDLEVMGPACYQKATETCYYKEGFFMVVNKTACIQKIFAHPTSQLGELEKK